MTRGFWEYCRNKTLHMFLFTIFLESYSQLTSEIHPLLLLFSCYSLIVIKREDTNEQQRGSQNTYEIIVNVENI